MMDTDPTNELGGYCGQQSRCEPVSFFFFGLFVFVILFLFVVLLLFLGGPNNLPLV